MSKYSILSEAQKERRRINSRAWAARNPDKVKAFKRNIPTREKACEYASRYRSKLSQEQIILRRARSRAIKKGFEFNLTIEDVVIPEFCPYFTDKRLQVGTDYAPSMDRIDSSKGYIKGNVEIISRRANTIKNMGTSKEHRLISDRLEQLCL